MTLICVILFCIQSYDILIQFVAKKTSIGVETLLEPLLLLPCVTICPAQATKFANKDLRIVDEQNFVDSTYDLKDLVPQYNSNLSHWKLLKEVTSQL